MDLYASIWSLLPPLIAIALALITKEVYSSLFIGIFVGGLLYSNFNIVGAMNHVFIDGMMGSSGDEGVTPGALTDPYNVGILIFLVVLGIMVVMMNRAGGSAAFGRWASERVHTKAGAQLATVALGVMIFIDDYFNCLTVGTVMRPLTDRHGISRAKLAYLIDATAAPICIIAPISSWAAAVSGFVEGANGLELFIRAIPYNFYALLTLVMVITLAASRFDYGPMKVAEMSDILNDRHKTYHASITGADPQEDEEVSPNGKMIHLLLPVLVLIASCVVGMIYSGGFFEGSDFVTAFSDSDASVGLVFGSVVALVFTILLMLGTRVMDFRTTMTSIPEGFKSMVPAILILTFAWTLKNMTDSLGAKEYVAGVVNSTANSETLMSFLPALVFLVGCGLSFATGTSWGTFGILIPIVVSVFGGELSNELMIISISACMAGAVCGDHCSPISDTTIMASAGGQCDHILHVSTQLPYVITVASVSLVTYLIAGFIRNWLIVLPLGIALILVTLFIIRRLTTKNEAQA